MKILSSIDTSNLNKLFVRSNKYGNIEEESADIYQMIAKFYKKKIEEM